MRKLTLKKIKKLAEKALKDKPKCKPPKGHVYLEDCKPGDKFEISGKTKGILIECNVNANVIITDVHSDRDTTLLGKKIIASQTEVIKI